MDLAPLELLDQLGKPRKILRLDDPPGEVAECIYWQGFRMDIDSLGHQEGVVADTAEDALVLRQRRQQQRQIRWPRMVL
ncbi:MAG: hypothetical protein Q8N46_05350 [Anaerolineales bacterium]|nr:hypothetical protein [Anaerolineales bacterium]